MEGIAGTYGNADKALVVRMLEAVRHRGPDARKIVMDDRTALGACELALRTGQRPLGVYEDDGLAVASDSCIFNRRALLSEVLGDEFSEDVPDSELVLMLYKRDGAGAFNKIDGGFAIALIDKGRVVLARDKYGLKPLYISTNSRRGVFSSEMKAQVKCDGRFNPFPPGSVFVQGRGYTRLQPLRTPSPSSSKDRSMVASELRKSLVESSEACVQGAEHVNILLSGGIDSSVVAAAAALTEADLSTVCVGMDASEDVEMARKVAEHLGTNHREKIYSVDEMLEVLDEAVYAAESFDCPLIRSCIPNFIATKTVTGPGRVILCGEGGDEVFAGYDYMRGIRGDGQLRKERVALLTCSHMTGFQRVDRMTAYASLDGKMPLMHGAVVNLGLALGRKVLIGPGLEQSKLVLRKAFEEMLPPEVVWRRKQRFSDGAGSIRALEAVADELISDADFEREKRSAPKNRIRTKEELMYYRSFTKYFHSESAESAVGFTPRP